MMKDYKSETEVLKLILKGNLGTSGDDVWIHSYREHRYDVKYKEWKLHESVIGYYVIRAFGDDGPIKMVNHQTFDSALEQFTEMLRSEDSEEE